MKFNVHQPIYLQIANYISEKILSNAWQEGEKLPSAKELASEVDVTPNTATKAYTIMHQQGIIENKRGIGYFINPDSERKIKAIKKEQFINEDLPSIFKTMYLLDIDINELELKYSDFIDKNKLL